MERGALPRLTVAQLSPAHADEDVSLEHKRERNRSWDQFAPACCPRNLPAPRPRPHPRSLRLDRRAAGAHGSYH